MIKIVLQKIRCRFKLSSVTAVGLLMSSGVATAGGYIFAGESLGTGIVAHPTGYSGQGGDIEVKVCIVPGTPNATDMIQSVQNNVAVWNGQQSTTSNLRTPTNFSGFNVDFESVSLHEVGHCVGLAHPNLASESGLSGADSNYTRSTNGADNEFNIDSGVDIVNGSPDDVRGDDVNTHFFYHGINNPFAEFDVTDGTTYSSDVTQLPMGDLFPANSDRDVSRLSRYNAPFSEASMQQGSFGGEVQRTLGHDDVVTRRYAMSGLDEIQGTADDYSTTLVFEGISDDADCDINISFDDTQTGFAVCRAEGVFISGDDVGITSADIFFNTGFNWVFNNVAPCNESVDLVADEWKQISLPCQVGVSTGDTVADVFGDDLGLTTLGVQWAMFEYVVTEDATGVSQGAYKALALTDVVSSGKGYWIKTLESGKTVDVSGEYNSQMDFPVEVDTTGGDEFGWTMTGMPFRFPNVFADTQVIDLDGSVLSLADADPILSTGPEADLPVVANTACTVGTGSQPECKVAQFGFIWRGEAVGYEQVDLTSGSLSSFDAVWMYGSDDGYKIRFPMTTVERTSP